jgi:ribonucleoside-diphosphate reductase alpha chain
MRPRGGFVEGIGNETPGAVRMLDMWDTQSAVITAGSGQKTKKEKAKIKIRKGAQMVTMSCWHPDIEEFITAKQTPGRLTKFNMSVLITDEFMNAVENHLPWNLVFPDFDSNKEIYDNEWDGFLDTWIQKGYPIKTYKTFNDANELWDLIMKSTYNRNEPGVLFIDSINRLNNLFYAEKIDATNPCGEQLLPHGGVCLLGSLNLTQFIDFDKKDWNYNKLAQVIPIAVRFMDNVNDITYVPLEIQKENLRRVIIQ